MRDHQLEITLREATDPNLNLDLPRIILLFKIEVEETLTTEAAMVMTLAIALTKIATTMITPKEEILVHPDTPNKSKELQMIELHLPDIDNPFTIFPSSFELILIST